MRSSDRSTDSDHIYLSLSEHIENDINSDILVSGFQLLLQRNLIYDIDVTIGHCQPRL